MISLKNRYPSVDNKGQVSYGGSQLWASGKNMQCCGCGVIACADTLLYLSRFHPEMHLDFCPYNGSIIPLEDYEKFLKTISPKYFPLIPRFGINGIALVAGLKRIFYRSKSPLKISWGGKKDSILDNIRRMLERDIPVILSIGPNFPMLLGNNQVNFYYMTGDGAYKRAASIRSHYVVVTAMDDNLLQISSWGRKLYIRIDEYMEYIDKYSSALVSNIVNIK